MFKDRSALITGASSGIGEALALELAREGAGLILVARREDRLRSLAEKALSLGAARAEWVIADLCDPGVSERVCAQVGTMGQMVDVLVNCAGIGEYGRFVDQKFDDLEAMIRINMISLMGLTHRFVPQMIERRRGWILNVASTAAYQPTPYMAIYGATKTAVLSFSAALAEEVRGTGVQVTCLCPGPVRTEFFNRGGYQDRATDFQRLAGSAEFVARKGIAGLKAGKRVVVPGVLNKIGAWSVRLGTIKMAARVSGKILGPRT